MSHISDLETKARLRRISGAYRDRLRPAVRQHLVREAVAAVSAGGHAAWSPSHALPRLAAAAAVVGLLLVPAFQMVEMPEKARSGVQDLQVRQVDGKVVLTWRNGDQPHRIVRATSREELQHASDLPGEVVRGESWVDSHDDGAPIVFYLVD